MMVGGARFDAIRIVVAIILAELLPLVLLFAVVGIYSVIRQPGSLSPEEFAPRAGLWVGPIGGFVATLLFAWWAARRAAKRMVAHGAIVGVGTAAPRLRTGSFAGRSRCHSARVFRFQHRSNSGRFRRRLAGEARLGSRLGIVGLGRRRGLTEPMPKAEALREAKVWLRSRGRAEALALTAELSGGVEQGKGNKGRQAVDLADMVPGGDDGDRPYASPHFWAAFVLAGDPD